MPVLDNKVSSNLIIELLSWAKTVNILGLPWYLINTSFKNPNISVTNGVPLINCFIWSVELTSKSKTISNVFALSNTLPKIVLTKPRSPEIISSNKKNSFFL